MLAGSHPERRLVIGIQEITQDKSNAFCLVELLKKFKRRTDLCTLTLWFFTQ
jgi:hypothetical protein